MKGREKSAGLLLYRLWNGGIEVFLVHPGGPFWAKKDQGAWTIPKGEIEPNEEPLQAAIREFAEETGTTVCGTFHPLPTCRQTGGKVILAWATEGAINAEAVKSNTFEMEWPPRSGKRRRFPEVDRAQWFALDEARKRINKAQVALLAALTKSLGK